MHAHRVWAAREADPSSPPPRTDPRLYAPCPSCQGGDAKADCAACEGVGAVYVGGAPSTYQDGEPAPEWLAATADLLSARAAIERFGLAGWLALEGLEVGELHPLFPEALSFLDAELERHEQADRVADAEAARRRRR